MRSNISAAWSAENRRQVRSVHLYQWLDVLQTLAIDLLTVADPHLLEQIEREGLSLSTIEHHMKTDCFAALLLWHLLQARMSIEQIQVIDVGSAFSRLMDLIGGRIALPDDEIGRRLRAHFSGAEPQDRITALDATGARNS